MPFVSLSHVVGWMCQEVRPTGIFFSKNFGFHYRSREEIIKIPRFYERIAPMMPPRIFRRYFRMYEETLGSLTNYLSNNPILYQPPRYVRIPLAKKVAMTTAYLGSSTATIQ